MRRLTLVLPLLCLGLFGCSPSPPPRPPAPAAAPGPPAVACHGVELASCLGIARDAAAALVDGPDPVVLVEVYPEFVAVELAAGTGRSQSTYEAGAGAPATFTEWVEAASVPLEPQSSPLGGTATPLTLGHCGIASPIDVDGSFWDAVGAIPQVASIINATDGEFRLVGPDEAEFVTGDARVSLRRHAGAKSPPGCD